MAKGFGGMNNMQGILKQAQAMQEKMARMQEEAENKTVEVAVGGGMVKVIANGKNRIISLKIAPEIIDPEDPEMLQDLVISAVNEAQEKVQQMVQDEMGKITGGMKIPGFM